MRKKVQYRIIVTALIIFSFICKAAFSNAVNGDDLIFVDPLYKVFKYSTNLPVARPVVDVVRGEHATFQLVYHPDKKVAQLSAKIVSVKSSNGSTIAGGEVRFVGYVHQGKYAEHQGKDAIKSKDGFFPDPLFEDDFVAVEKDDNQAIWLTIPISLNQPAGDYTGIVTVSVKFADGTLDKFDKTFSITVYPITISNETLWVSNWAAMLNPGYLPIKKPETVKMYSDAYWEGIKGLAKKFRQYRQNVVRVEMIKLISYTKQNGKYSFDFSRADKMISIFLQSGIKRIEGDFVGEKMAGWDGPLGFVLPKDDGAPTDSRALRKVGQDDESGADFYRQYLKALYSHLKSKGWENLYFLHISDEPTTDNTKEYKKLLAFVKSVEPRIKLLEAVNQADPVPGLDIQVPLLSYLRYGGINKFVNSRKKNGGETWFYICMNPQYNYPNRFLENPLIKTRLLHWDNFKYNLTGFLHWGYNIWTGYPYDFAKSTSIGGDAWIVYPKDGKILSSIRLEAMRDGIIDYELLRLLEKKNAMLAKKIADAIVYDFDSVNTDIDNFRNVRKSILTSLSQ